MAAKSPLTPGGTTSTEFEPSQSAGDDLVIEDITVLDAPPVEVTRTSPSIDIGSDLSLLADEQRVPLGPQTRNISEEGSLREFFGPELSAGLGITALFVVFAIVLAMGAREQPRNLDVGDEPGVVAEVVETPVAPPAEIEVEIGEAVTLERE